MNVVVALAAIDGVAALAVKDPVVACASQDAVVAGTRLNVVTGGGCVSRFPQRCGVDHIVGEGAANLVLCVDLGAVGLIEGHLKIKFRVVKLQLLDVVQTVRAVVLFVKHQHAAIGFVAAKGKAALFTDKTCNIGAGAAAQGVISLSTF